jgi:hypothetical protein
MSVAIDAAARGTHADPAAKADQYLSNLNSTFRVATGWNFRSSPRVAATIEKIKLHLPKQVRARRGQADLKLIYQHIAGWGATGQLSLPQLTVAAVVLFMADTLGRAQAVRGLPLIGEHAYFCRADGTKCEPGVAVGFRFRLQGQKTVSGTLSDWFVIKKARSSRSSLTSAEHKRTCTISVLATLVAKLGDDAIDGKAATYPETGEYRKYGPSFFLAAGKAKTATMRIMSCRMISAAVTKVLTESKFIQDKQPGEASHVLRKHCTSAVLLLRLPHVPDAVVHERAHHSATTWETRYRTEQCDRQAEAFARLPQASRDLSIEEALRL